MMAAVEVPVLEMVTAFEQQTINRRSSSHVGRARVRSAPAFAVGTDL